jgi:hypothetical protein
LKPFAVMSSEENVNGLIVPAKLGVNWVLPAVL